MGFLDDLSAMGQDISTKTKNMGDIGRLNSTIKETEKNIDRYYLQLGKMYKQQHLDNCEPQYKDIIDAIKASEAKVVACRKEVNALKGIVICPNCHAEISSASAFCTSCGKPIVTAARPTASAVKSVALAKCPNCGSFVNPTSKFCTTCGASMVGVQPVPMQNAYSAPANAAPVSAPYVPYDSQTAEPAAPQNNAFDYSAPVAGFGAEENNPEPANSEYDDFSGAYSSGNADKFFEVDENKDNAGASASAVRKCPCCGAEVEADFAFCTECGARME